MSDDEKPKTQVNVPLQNPNDQVITHGHTPRQPAGKPNTDKDNLHVFK